MAWVTALRLVFFRVIRIFIAFFGLVLTPAVLYEHHMIILEVVRLIDFWANVAVGILAIFVNIWLYAAAGELIAATPKDVFPLSIWLANAGSMLIYVLSIFVALIGCLQVRKPGLYEGCVLIAMLLALYLRACGGNLRKRSEKYGLLEK